MMPSIPAQREQLPFQAVDPSSSLPAKGPEVDHQIHNSLLMYSQHPPILCNDFEVDLKEKQRRPSNAFILFRSDFLKRKLISKGQETRQHKLSIIAAKCWNKLTREEKKKWFLEAEREKKAHALKYADYQSQPRTRARSKRESRIMASPRELEHLGRLADMAYQEIVNDIPSQLARESATSLSTSLTTVLASGSPTLPPRVKGIELSTLDCCQEQEQLSQQSPFSSPAGEVGQLSLPQRYQPLQTASASDFSPFQDVGMIPTVSHCYATFNCPVHFSQSMVFPDYNNCSTCVCPDMPDCE
jgi:HMG (high mobility group) box